MSVFLNTIIKSLHNFNAKKVDKLAYSMSNIKFVLSNPICTDL